MSAAVLVAYATRYGSTQEVAEVVSATLRAAGLEVATRSVRQVRALEGYGTIVLGSPLFMFHWHKDALRFLEQHRAALTQLPAAIFVLGPTHDPHDEQEWQDSRAQIAKELAKFPWFTPVDVAMFGGKYEPASLRFPIRWLAGKTPASDIRDWAAIRAWAGDLAAKFDRAMGQQSESA